MKYNLILNILSSIPVILLVTYFIPFLGICLIILRFIVYKNKKLSTCIWLIVIGLVLLIPKIINKLWPIELLSDNEALINNFIHFSKILISSGVILLVIYLLLNALGEKLGNNLKNYIINEEKKNEEISRQNDLIIKEKQMKAKNTRVVYCPHCGADNILTSKTGVCKYCRKNIE